jgi:high-affinity iron transporter
MLNVVLVVWRESLEAMLIIGILHAWLVRNEAGRRGRNALWLGVAAGVLLAVALGWGMLKAQSALAGDALEYFQTGVLFVAAALITQMVFWMAKHARNMRRQLEAELSSAADAGNWFGVAAIAALTVAREGAETVVFLYGASFEAGGSSLGAAAALGVVLAAATSWLAARGLRLANTARLLRISSFLLLVFASALLVSGVDRLIGNGHLPPLVEPLWNSSALLDDASGAGNLVAQLAGYRAQPSLMLLIVWAAYWLIAVVSLRRARRA